MKYWIFENFWKLGGGQLNEEYGILFLIFTYNLYNIEILIIFINYFKWHKIIIIFI